jgi:uncharacterized protein YecE (DUF72 family)
MKRGKIIMGTSGWSYKEWKGIFYPQALAAKDWLSYYSTVFPVTEINSSFYHLPRNETIYNWMDKVSSHFMFCPKISRFLTHMKEPIRTGSIFLGIGFVNVTCKIGS